MLFSKKITDELRNTDENTSLYLKDSNHREKNENDSSNKNSEDTSSKEENKEDDDKLGFNKKYEGKNKDIVIPVNKEDASKKETEPNFENTSEIPYTVVNTIGRWEKHNIYQKNFFEDGNKIIVKFSYDHLIEVLKHVDNYSDKKFLQKLRFLRRKYKLNKEQEGKKDCQLASDIYQAISKIDMLNLKYVSYNVNYNFKYSINQSFRMFKSILKETENKKFIPLKNNKFINFEDVSKIVYYIKKEKIQLLVGNIFDTNSYKQEGYTVNKDKESFVEFRDEIQLSKRDNANEDEIISTSMRKGILKNA